MKVKVWNDNTYDLKETFKGDPIHIPAGKFIEMERFEANDYKGQYLPPVLSGDGTQDPKSFKKIRLETITDEDEDVQVLAHVCMSCKKSYESEPVLKAHIETAHAEATRLEIPEVDEKLRKKKKVG